MNGQVRSRRIEVAGLTPEPAIDVRHSASAAAGVDARPNVVARSSSARRAKDWASLRDFGACPAVAPSHSPVSASAVAVVSTATVAVLPARRGAHQECSPSQQQRTP